ncbi:class I SAM-dependent methyltransferase [Actinophytocola sp.]|uniref:class I SAM-dependent methyltransferase n=1 Tax=Actinophytocola sp. TaxID=1872138 RepID=UPI00389AE9E0
MDWRTWHDEYDQPGSWMARRLEVVQHWIRAVLDSSPPGPLRVVSLCAGQGRDLLEVLADHPRRGDVRARLVELDPRNTAVAEEAGVPGVEVRTADASLTEHYEGMVPADLVLVCGVFGNITDEDVRRTVGFCTRLTRTGGTVIWTRHREPPDLVPSVCAWFEEVGFAREWVSPADADFGVGVHRFTGRPRPLGKARMFTFVGYDRLAQES